MTKDEYIEKLENHILDDLYVARDKLNHIELLIERSRKERLRSEASVEPSAEKVEELRTEVKRLHDDIETICAIPMMTRSLQQNRFLEQLLDHIAAMPVEFDSIDHALEFYRSLAPREEQFLVEEDFGPGEPIIVPEPLDVRSWIAREAEIAEAMFHSSFARKHHPLPRGDHRLPTTITYLQMAAHPDPRVGRGKLTACGSNMRVESLSNCDPAQRNALARFWYNRVGRSCLWYERNLWTDYELNRHLQSPNVTMLALCVTGYPVGFAELHQHNAHGLGVELTYFGLFPDAIGFGYGKWFLSWIVDHVWSMSVQPNRFYTYTNVLDSPSALPNYQRAGFKVSHVQKATYIDPRTMWPHHMQRYDLSSYPWLQSSEYDKLYKEISEGL